MVPRNNNIWSYILYPPGIVKYETIVDRDKTTLIGLSRGDFNPSKTAGPFLGQTT